jgi:hypothetical protein
MAGPGRETTGRAGRDGMLVTVTSVGIAGTARARVDGGTADRNSTHAARALAVLIGRAIATGETPGE